MRVPVVMMEGGQLEMSGANGLLVRRMDWVGSDGLQILRRVWVEASDSGQYG